MLVNELNKFEFNSSLGYNWTSGEYSSWTESRWENLSIRIFVKASTAQEVTVFVFGVFVLILGFAITYWMDAKSKILFPLR